VLAFGYPKSADSRRRYTRPGAVVFNARMDKETVLAYNARNIEEFRANGGKLGGNFEGAPVLLLTTVGAKSGAARTSPMMYLNENGRVYVFASNAGKDVHPFWYTNVLANPMVTVEIGDRTYQATAIDVIDEERDRVYAAQATLYPGFAEYQAGTTRIIPVLELVEQTPAI
jgi:deazaflavin-dependent oxidoreductase (nitroreductase family)